MGDEKLANEYRTNFAGYLTYRQLSFLITPFLIRCGTSAASVTMLTLVLGAMMPIAAWSGGSRAYLYVAGLAFLRNLFDHVDGDIARTVGTSSPSGQFLDSFAGVTTWVFLFLSLGILIDHGHATGLWIQQHGVLLGLAGAILFLFAKHSRLYVKYNFSERSPSFTPEDFSAKTVVISLLSDVGAVFPLILVVAGTVQAVDGALFLLLAHTTLVFVYTHYRIFRILGSST